jgi:hypothetical protein
LIVIASPTGRSTSDSTIIRRSMSSAWCSVRPVLCPRRRRGPTLRLSRLPPAYQEPYQVCEPSRAVRIISRPVPGSRRLVCTPRSLKLC